jgi:hypothetical protein
MELAVGSGAGAGAGNCIWIAIYCTVCTKIWVNARGNFHDRRFSWLPLRFGETFDLLKFFNFERMIDSMEPPFSPE